MMTKDDENDFIHDSNRGICLKLLSNNINKLF